jgi:hypothetical protein
MIKIRLKILEITTNKLFLILLLSLSISQLDFITIRYECDYLGEMGPEYYGFPFIYRTQIPWVNSISGKFYILGYICNVSVIYTLLFLLVKLSEKLSINKRIMKFLKIITSLITIILFIFASLFFTIIEWNFEWKYNHIENYGGKPLKCEKHLEFFKSGQ